MKTLEIIKTIMKNKKKKKMMDNFILMDIMTI